jgi:hypothetical protein
MIVCAITTRIILACTWLGQALCVCQQSLEDEFENPPGCLVYNLLYTDDV